MRSVVVVFPASMCAMIPMLPVRARGYSRITSSLSFPLCLLASTAIFSAGCAMGSALPPVVSERLVRLCHLVKVFLALDRRAGVVRGVDQLRREPVRHRLLLAPAAVLHEPSKRKRRRAPARDFDRNLIRRATDAAAAHLELRPDVVDRLLQPRDLLVARAVLQSVERRVHDVLGGATLAALQHLVHQLRYERAPVHGVENDLALLDRALAWHLFSRSSFSTSSPWHRSEAAGFRSGVALRAVLRARLLSITHAGRVQRRADDLVPHTGAARHAAAAHEHDRVLLQVVADPRDVRVHLGPARQPHARDFPKRRVRLLRRHREHARADTPPLRRALQRGRLRLRPLRLAAVTDQLLDRRHRFLPQTRRRAWACSGTSGAQISRDGGCRWLIADALRPRPDRNARTEASRANAKVSTRLGAAEFPARNAESDRLDLTPR